MTQLRDALALPIQGYNDPATSPITACLPVANHVGGTDILVMRRADSTMSAGDGASIPNAALTANGIYIQANADPTALPVVAVATGASATDQTAFNLMNKDPTKYAPIRKYHVHIY